MGYSERREYMRKYQREWIAKRRAAWFSDKKCVDCGSKEKLEIDHVDREDKVTHAVWSWKKSRRDEELAKCEVRCNSCHKKRSAKQSLEWLSGENSVNCKITDVQVDEIRYKYSLGGTTHKKLAEEYGISKTHVGNIVNYKVRKIKTIR